MTSARVSELTEQVLELSGKNFALLKIAHILALVALPHCRTQDTAVDLSRLSMDLLSQTEYLEKLYPAEFDPVADALQPLVEGYQDDQETILKAISYTNLFGAVREQLKAFERIKSGESHYTRLIERPELLPMLGGFLQWVLSGETASPVEVFAHYSGITRAELERVGIILDERGPKHETELPDLSKNGEPDCNR